MVKVRRGDADVITYVTGDLLKSDAQCLVNTVNCEGYMGKGIAYQFKLAYPKNNEDYVKSCKNGDLRIGRLHFFREKGKIIINFPTKDRWRENSKIEYIESGLNELILLIQKLKIISIAIPPLGSGNGGLIWADVKALIEEKLLIVSNDVDILIYEPSKNFLLKAISEPKLSFSALILMLIKNNLEQFNRLRLQKTAYFVNLLSQQKYFNFIKYKFGPYDYAIDVVSRSIKEFQEFHNVESTVEAYEIAYRKLISDSIDRKLFFFIPFIKKACEYVNMIESDKELECIVTILFLIEESGILSEDEIIIAFHDWSQDKAERFTKTDIINGVKFLYEMKLIERLLTGYSLSNMITVMGSNA